MLSGLSLSLSLSVVVIVVHVVDGYHWSEVYGSDYGSFDKFGYSVGISCSDYVVVGAYDNDDYGEGTGSAYIYSKDSVTGNWSQETKILPGPDECGKNDNFGWSVDISDNVVIIGAPKDDDVGKNAGAAYIYRKNENTGEWDETKLLTNDTSTIGTGCGSAVAISGDSAIVGCYQSSNGFAFIYEYIDYEWVETAKIAGCQNFGYSVSIYKSKYAIIGTYEDDTEANNAGAAYIYTKNNETGIWNFTQKLYAGNAGKKDYFGYSVDICNDYLIVGAIHEDSEASNAGSAYIYKKFLSGGNNTNIWFETQQLTSSFTSENAYFGTSVSLNCDSNNYYAIIGADGDNTLENEGGASYLFKLRYNVNNGHNEYYEEYWNETKQLIATDIYEGDRFGKSVSACDDCVVIGDPYHDDVAQDAGSAFIVCDILKLEPTPSPTSMTSEPSTSRGTPPPSPVTNTPTAQTPSPTSPTYAPTSVSNPPTGVTSPPTRVTYGPTPETLAPSSVTLSPTPVTNSPTTPTYVPTSPTYQPTSPTYAPTLPTIEPTPNTPSPSLPTSEPTSPTYVPTSPTYIPTTPTYIPTSPTVEPSTPTNEPTVPTYIPTLPTNEPTSPTYEPTLPTIEPTSPTYIPTSPTYTPTSPTIEPTPPSSSPTSSPTDDIITCNNNCQESSCEEEYLKTNYIYCQTYEACKNSHISVSENVYCTGDNGCYSSYITSTNGNIYCRGNHACSKSEIESSNSDIECSGRKSCQLSDLIGNNGILCNGYASCNNTYINTNNAICSGHYGCSNSQIISSDSLITYGYRSCQFCDIKYTPNIYARGELSLANSIISSYTLNNLNIYADGKGPLNNTILYCYDGSTCNVKCNSGSSCEGLIYFCDTSGAQCQIDCDDDCTQCPTIISGNLALEMVNQENLVKVDVRVMHQNLENEQEEKQLSSSSNIIYTSPDKQDNDNNTFMHFKINYLLILIVVFQTVIIIFCGKNPLLLSLFNKHQQYKYHLIPDP